MQEKLIKISNLLQKPLLLMLKPPPAELVDGANQIGNLPRNKSSAKNVRSGNWLN